MDETALFTLLKTTGLPVAYHHFTSPPAPPYILYLVDEAEGRGSDDRNEIKQTNFLIELYTVKKDLVNQAKIEKLLDDRGIEYRLFEAFLDTEDLYQAVYHLEFTTKIGRN